MPKQTKEMPNPENIPEELILFWERPYFKGLNKRNDDAAGRKALKSAVLDVWTSDAALLFFFYCNGNPVFKIDAQLLLAYKKRTTVTCFSVSEMR